MCVGSRALGMGHRSADASESEEMGGNCGSRLALVRLKLNSVPALPQSGSGADDEEEEEVEADMERWLVVSEEEDYV